MGMDSTLHLARDRKVLEAGFEHWSANPEDYNYVREVWYGRKFWSVLQEMSWLRDYKDDECGTYVELTRENLEEMLNHCAHHQDYFGGFSTVPDLCQLLWEWDALEADGLKIFYEADW